LAYTAFEYLARINTGLAKGIHDIGALAHQSTGFYKPADGKRARDRITRCQSGKLRTPTT